MHDLPGGVCSGRPSRSLQAFTTAARRAAATFGAMTGTTAAVAAALSARTALLRAFARDGMTRG